MRDDRLVEMRVFRALVAAGSFTAAAHDLGASQPFVSQTLRRLEERLGARLLHRSTRGQRLTPEGARFLEAAQGVLDAVEAAETEWQRDARRIEGQLRVSVPIAFGLDRITPLVPAFLAQHPDLSLDLRLTDDTESLIDDRIDVAIRMGRLPDSGLMHRRICRLQRIVVAAPALLARHGTPQRVADLEGFPCLAWDGERAHLNRWRFREDGAEIVHRARGRFSSNQGMSLARMCLAGFGALRMAEHLARPAIADGRLTQILARQTAADDTAIHAVFLPDRHLVPRIRGFVDFMAAAFRDPDWERGAA